MKTGMKTGMEKQQNTDKSKKQHNTDKNNAHTLTQYLKPKNPNNLTQREIKGHPSHATMTIYRHQKMMTSNTQNAQLKAIEDDV